MSDDAAPTIPYPRGATPHRRQDHVAIPARGARSRLCWKAWVGSSVSHPSPPEPSAQLLSRSSGTHRQPYEAGRNRISDLMKGVAVDDQRGASRMPGGLIFRASLILLLCLVAAPAAAELPELPRDYVDTSLVIPTGAAIVVPNGGDLQKALNVASPVTSSFSRPAPSTRGRSRSPQDRQRVDRRGVVPRPRVRGRSTRAALGCAEDGGARRGATLGVADGARRSPLPVRGPGDPACGGHVHVQHRGRGQRCAQPRRHPAPRDLRSVLSARGQPSGGAAGGGHERRAHRRHRLVSRRPEGSEQRLPGDCWLEARAHSRS